MSRYDSPTSVNFSDGMIGLIDYVNDVTFSWFSNLLLIGIWVIVFMGFYKSKDDPKGAFAVAGYSTFVVSLLFWIGGWVSGATMGIVVAIAIVGTIPLLLDN